MASVPEPVQSQKIKREIRLSLQGQVGKHMAHCRHELESMPAETAGHYYFLPGTRKEINNEVFVWRIGLQTGFGGR